MDKEDARKQTLAQRHERRKQAVRLHKRDMGVKQIGTMRGLSYPTVTSGIDRFEAGGWAASRRAPGALDKLPGSSRITASF